MRYRLDLVAALIALAIMVGLIATAAPDVAAYSDRSEEWCSERGGHLENHMSVYKGGLYCDFENGTSVRMATVEEVSDA